MSKLVWIAQRPVQIQTTISPLHWALACSHPTATAAATLDAGSHTPWATSPAGSCAVTAATSAVDICTPKGPTKAVSPSRAMVAGGKV